MAGAFNADCKRLSPAISCVKFPPRVDPNSGVFGTRVSQTLNFRRRDVIRRRGCAVSRRLFKFKSSNSSMPVNAISTSIIVVPATLYTTQFLFIMKRSFLSAFRPANPSNCASIQCRRFPNAARHIHQQVLSRQRPFLSSHKPQPSVSFIRKRYESSLAIAGDQSEPPKDTQPAYQLTFTCKPCSTRSSHRVSKQGYHHGTTLITCPSCKARHLISDHLKIFNDEPITLEDILSKTLPDGKPLTDLLKKGKLGMRQGAMIANESDEDIEFWEDGSETVHEKAT